ncbi:MAG: CDP-glycerol glycerophosphotransferase family protein [Lachnospiraceae bacterium]|nr:CDP-glycerol glycerophosphotransferase family protein [Lachnospiraceae bacterium]
MVVIIKIGTFFLNFIYFFIKLFPVKKQVTFISRQSNEVPFEFRMIAKELRRRDPDIKIKYLCRTLDGGIQSSVWNKVKYAFHMFTQMYYIATSKVVILDTYCIVVSLLKHKKQLKVIQMWHSMGTMKKFGYQILDQGEGSDSKVAHAMKMHHNYDYIFCAGEGYLHILAVGFNYEDDYMRVYPLPRVDLLQSRHYKEKKRKQIFEKYPKLKEKPVILYVPTFRKDETRFVDACSKIMKSLDEDYNLVMKLHPLSKMKIDTEKVFACEEFSSFEMLFAADYVVSDYSCIIYEAAILNLPIHFYNFDLDEYEGVRGLNIDYKNDLPGMISDDFGKIMNAIKYETYDFDKLNDLKNKYIRPTNHATKDIADFVESLL